MRHTVEKGDATYEVSKGKQSITVGGSQAVEVGDGHTLTVKSGDHSIQVKSGVGA